MVKVPNTTESVPTKKKATKKRSTKKKATKKKSVKSKKKEVQEEKVEELKSDPSRDAVSEAGSKRPIVYPKVDAMIFNFDDGSGLTEETAKKFLGWTVPKNKDKPFKDPTFVDREGVTVVCTNNAANRFFYTRLAERWMWEMLLNNWKQNGQTFTIGKTGLTIDCQHRLVGLVWACQEYRLNPDKYPNLEAPPNIEAIVVVGIDETREVVNTINTGKERTVSDAIYSSGLFSGETKKTIKTLSRFTAQATQLIWKRVEESESSLCPNIENHNIIEFIERHPRILDSVKFIYEEDSESSLSSLHPAGYCAGLHYLMSVSTSNPSKYLETRTEGCLSFANDERANRYWINLADNHQWFIPLVTKFNKFNARDGGSTIQEREAVICKSWKVWAAKGSRSLSNKDISLQYYTMEDGIRELSQYPRIRGIDTFNPLA